MLNASCVLFSRNFWTMKHFDNKDVTVISVCPSALFVRKCRWFCSCAPPCCHTAGGHWHGTTAGTAGGCSGHGWCAGWHGTQQIPEAVGHCCVFPSDSSQSTILPQSSFSTVTGCPLYWGLSAEPSKDPKQTFFLLYLFHSTFFSCHPYEGCCCWSFLMLF